MHTLRVSHARVQLAAPPPPPPCSVRPYTSHRWCACGASWWHGVGRGAAHFAVAVDIDGLDEFLQLLLRGLHAHDTHHCGQLLRLDVPIAIAVYGGTRGTRGVGTCRGSLFHAGRANCASPLSGGDRPASSIAGSAALQPLLPWRLPTVVLLGFLKAHRAPNLANASCISISWAVDRHGISGLSLPDSLSAQSKAATQSEPLSRRVADETAERQQARAHPISFSCRPRPPAPPCYRSHPLEPQGVEAP